MDGAILFIYLKKAEEQENKEWYYRLAKDHFAYIGAYRECIDEIHQLKKENWRIVMDPKVDYLIRIKAAKELHSLSKTSVLLLRDLSFVANLSKYYNVSKFEKALPSKSSSISVNKYKK